MSASNQVFPRAEARDLTGATRWLPDAFEGERKMVFVAFRRQQQTVIDSWALWLRAQASGIFADEVPVLARHWAPFRPVIDGGMAAAIRDTEARQRTLTVYGDLRRLTTPLQITDRSTVWIFLVARGRRILERASGGYRADTAERLLAA